MSAFSPTSGISQGPQRFHGLDAARAIALLIGILHHGIESLVSYSKSDWITQDSQDSLLIDIIFYISHVFRMQAFFLMSGFFAHQLFHRKGSREFIINRAKRLLLPFVIFWPVLYAITWNLWVWGVQYNRGIPHDEAVATLPHYMIWLYGFPLMHLWFLYFLILFCTGVILFRPVIVLWVDHSGELRNRADIILSYLMNRDWGSLIIGFVMVFPMLGMTDWFGVDTSASGLVPRVYPFLLYGIYFTLGWFLHRQVSLIGNFEKFRKLNFIMGSITIFAVIIISLLFSEPANPSHARFILMGINTLYAFASVTTVFAFIGYMLKWFNKPSAAIRYLADGAYWGYLIHLPVVALFQILIAQIDLMWAIKLLIILIPSCIILWGTYQYGVKRTWVGVLLNGKRNA